MSGNPLHDADEVVGRITRAGSWDRRYRIQYEQPEPVRVTWGDVIGALAGFVVFSALFVGVWVWMAILDAGVNGPNQWTP